MLSEALPKIITAEVPGPKAKAVLERRKNAVLQAIRTVYPCVIKRGEGAVFEDVDGNIFLDWVGGVGVLNAGYSHPEIVAAVKEQADKFFHAMVNIVTHEGYVALAEKMNSIVPLKEEKTRTMFVNSGAEAVENAVKIARSSTKRPNIIVFSGAFHGRTLLCGAMTSKKSYYNGLGPLPDGIYRAEFPYLYRRPKGFTESEAIDFYINRLKTVFEEASPAQYVAAIVVEPVQGEGGLFTAKKEFLKELRSLCDKNNLLLIFDEVQCGVGRTGKFFAFENFGVKPDIITLAKALANGLPLGAVIAAKKAENVFTYGDHGSTFGGNPVSCAAAIAVLETMTPGFLNKSLQTAKYLREKLEGLKKKHSIIKELRGIGLMLGIDLTIAGKDIAESCLKKGLIINCTHETVLRLLPPLIISKSDVDKAVKILDETMKQ